MAHVGAVQHAGANPHTRECTHAQNVRTHAPLAVAVALGVSEHVPVALGVCEHVAVALGVDVHVAVALSDPVRYFVGVPKWPCNADRLCRPRSIANGGEPGWNAGEPRGHSL